METMIGLGGLLAGIGVVRVCFAIGVYVPHPNRTRRHAHRAHGERAASATVAGRLVPDSV